MHSYKFCDFGKAIKTRLIDLDRNQNWLIEQVRLKTGKYFDSSYLHKILTGTLRTKSIVAAICEVLNIEAN